MYPVYIEGKLIGRYGSEGDLFAAEPNVEGQSCSCAEEMWMTHDRVKAAHTWMKENAASEDLLDAVRDLIEDADQLDEENSSLQDKVRSLEEKIAALQVELEALNKALRGVSDDLEAASRAIQRVL